MPSSSANTTVDLTTRLLWVTVFRTVAISLLLAVLVVRLLSRPSGHGISSQDSFSFVVIATVYGITLAYAVWMRRRLVGTRAAWLQVCADVALATGLVYVTGGADSPYSFTFLIAIIAASILLYEWGAVVAAIASTVVFTGLVVAIQFGVLAPSAGSAVPSGGRLGFILASNILAQVLIAGLASYLARMLWTTRGRLFAREADLRQITALHQKILLAIPSGLVTCDAEGRVSFINGSGEAILGASLSVRDQTIDKLLPGIRGLAQGKRAEVKVGTPKGEKILGLTTAPLGGVERGDLLVVFQDLTDLRRVEEELRRADRLAALGKLSAQVAHEIRNPLAAMRGAAQLIASNTTAMDDSSRRLVGILLRESDRLSGLVDEFLRFARPPPPVIRNFALDELVKETGEMLRTDPLARGIEFEVQVASVVARADPDQVRQVLINLLRNAFAAVEGAGRVRIVVVPGPSGGGQVRIWDSAGAIPVANASRIFEPFFTTKSGGTGLGLSTAHSLVRSNGGVLAMTSSPEEGTEFLLDLPGEEAAVALANC